MTFFCRADVIFEKSVEQSRFEQMHFEQLTLTPLHLISLILVYFDRFLGRDEELNKVMFA
jgi:hypothetical protein